jgi:hypothetical protein
MNWNFENRLYVIYSKWHRKFELQNILTLLIIEKTFLSCETCALSICLLLNFYVNDDERSALSCTSLQ